MSPWSESSKMPHPPFLSDALMQGEPPCNWSDFLSPQLRRFPRVYSRVRLRKALGHGIEGCVARVKFDDDDDSQFALKIFFDSVPNDEGWWPLEREARNVAVIEKVQAGLGRSSPNPIHVPAKRTTRLDCLRCLHAFSAEGQRSRHFDALPDDEKVAVSASFTRIRKCFGWTKVLGKDFRTMNKEIEIDYYAAKQGEATASHLEVDREYFAIVYEYIPPAKLELGAVQRQLDFFHHIGFHPCQDAHERNWQGPGILLDFGDYNSPVDKWFPGRSAYYAPVSARVLVDSKRLHEELEKEWDRVQELRHSGVGLTEEEQLEEKEEHARGDTARYVELGYRRNRWYKGYFDLSQEEIKNLGLKEDPLSHIQIREIEPRALWKAWKRYDKEKSEYLSQFTAVNKFNAGVSGSVPDAPSHPQ